jgi:hypothetical protein
MVFLLGLSNWMVGRIRVDQYKDMQREAIRLGAPGDVTTPFRGTASILEERTEAHQLYEDSVTRYRYYKLVRRGGRFLMTIGALLVVGALLRRITFPLPSRYRTQPRTN